jgi:hypothetical protein
MAAEEHSACRHHFDLPGDGLATVGSIHSIGLDLLDRRAAASTCSRQTMNLSSLCNPAGRFCLFLSLALRQAGSGGEGLYSLETNCQMLLLKGCQTTFLEPPRIFAASPRDS